MKFKGKKLGAGIGARQKKILAIAAVMAVLVIFASFLLSLGGSEPEQTPAAQDAPAASGGAQSGQLQIPASERYDYANMLNEPQQPMPDSSSGAAGELTPPAPEDNPFASMQPPQTAPAPAPSAEPAPVQPTAPAPSGPQAMLYCDSFATAAEAESRKALVAFQGLSSQVQAQGNAFVLAIGPFADRAEARARFADLADKGLVTQCSLTDI